MGLVRLLYCSRSRTPITLDSVRDLAASAALHNETVSITGVLAFDRDTYMQALEGPRAAVNELYLRIARDTRHHDVTLISYQDIQERWFEKWSMGFVGPVVKSQGMLERFGGNTFQPFELQAEHAAELLRTVSEAVLISGWSTPERA